MLRFFVFLLFIAVAVGAFYGGIRYQQARLAALQNATPQPSPSPSESPTALAQKRAALDSNPQKWLEANVPAQLTKEGVSKASDSKDSEFLYLYGRALMLTGNQRDAIQAFELALTNLRTEPRATLPLGTEVKLAEAAAALKQSGSGRTQEALMAEQKAARTLDDLLGLKSEAPAK